MFYTDLYFSLVCPGKSLDEYCLLSADRSFSPLPVPPRAGSNVGRAAVVMVTRAIFKTFNSGISILLKYII